MLQWVLIRNDISSSCPDLQANVENCQVPSLIKSTLKQLMLWVIALTDPANSCRPGTHIVSACEFLYAWRKDSSTTLMSSSSSMMPACLSKVFLLFLVKLLYLALQELVDLCCPGPFGSAGQL